MQIGSRDEGAKAVRKCWYR